MSASRIRSEFPKFDRKLRSVSAQSLSHASSMNWKKMAISAGFWLACLAGLIAMSCVALVAQAIPSSRTHTAIVFFAERSVSEQLWPGLFQVLQEDLSIENSDLQKTALSDRNPALLRESDLTKGIDFADVIEVKLRGRCDVVPQAYRPLPKGPLGWVSLVSGEIQPFIFIDCTRLALLLGPATLGLHQEGRRR